MIAPETVWCNACEAAMELGKNQRSIVANSNSRTGLQPPATSTWYVLFASTGTVARKGEGPFA